MSYSIHLSGELASGVDRTDAIARLAKLFNLPEERAAVLVAGKPRVIRKGLDSDSAEKYLAALRKAGAVAEILPEDLETSTQTSAQTLSAVTAPTDVPDWGIAPVGTILSEPREIPPLEVDISHLTLAEPGVTLVEPSHIPEPKIDISGLKLVSNSS